MSSSICHSPREVLALCYRHLNPGGIIVITTGDFASLMARCDRRQLAADDATAASMVFHPRKPAPYGEHAGTDHGHFEHPWKIVPLSLIRFQAAADARNAQSEGACAGRIGIPVNLFDAMRVVLRKETAGLDERSPELTQSTAGGLMPSACRAGSFYSRRGAALRAAGGVTFAERVFGLFQNGAFLAALALYLAFSVLWVWVLSFTPLSRAYPFVALAFV